MFVTYLAPHAADRYSSLPVYCLWSSCSCHIPSTPFSYTRKAHQTGLPCQSLKPKTFYRLPCTLRHAHWMFVMWTRGEHSESPEFGRTLQLLQWSLLPSTGGNETMYRSPKNSVIHIYSFGELFQSWLYGLWCWHTSSSDPDWIVTSLYWSFHLLFVLLYNPIYWTGISNFFYVNWINSLAPPTQTVLKLDCY